MDFTSYNQRNPSLFADCEPNKVSCFLDKLNQALKQPTVTAPIYTMLTSWATAGLGKPDLLNAGISVPDSLGRRLLLGKDVPVLVPKPTLESSGPRPVLRELEEEDAEEFPADTTIWMSKNGAKTDAIGYFGIEKNLEDKPFAVLKIKAMGKDGGFQSEDWLGFWNNATAIAKKNGVTNLVIDLVNNGGGSVELAAMITRSLLPAAGQDLICNLYNQRQTQYAKAWDKFAEVDAALEAFVNSPQAQKARSEALLALNTSAPANITALENRFLTQSEVLTNINNILITLTGFSSPILFNSSLLATIDARIRVGDFYSETLLKTVARLATDVTNLAGSGTNAPSSYKGLTFKNPFMQFFPEGTNMFGNLTQLVRGGKIGNFSESYMQDVCTKTFDLEVPPNDFERIVIATNGKCGSACAVLAETVRMVSEKMQGSLNVPMVRYLAWGGTGTYATVEEAKADLSATAFPGGVVIDQLKGLVTFYIAFINNAVYLQRSVQYLGLDESVLDSILESLPGFGYYLKSNPQVSLNQMYMRLLGPDALPIEYQFTKTDFYLSNWYRDVGDREAVKWKRSALVEMHADAAQAFDLMTTAPVTTDDSGLATGAIVGIVLGATAIGFVVFAGLAAAFGMVGGGVTSGGGGAAAAATSV
ncbi:hypothetical protein TrCOL_g7209 [Triparma columacea]|uniref:Tail specific protease domain-containing protein n=1 Tax=Triparma columacea TaxID=722753 RepID=A0A9W7FX52_9STRA|nr:hypothetical protein TrCOL_g7209 [Triparma columacea]